MLQTKFNPVNLPVIISYFLYPSFGLIAKILDVELGSTLDSLWFLLLVLTVSPKVELQLNCIVKKYYYYGTLLCVSFIILQFCLPVYISSDKLFFIRPFLMELKGWLFLLISIIWSIRFGLIEKKVLIRGASFLSILYILYSVYLLLTGSFYRFGLGSENNYDGLLLLLGYIIALTDKKKNLKILALLSLATIITMSKTGILCWMIINLFYFRRRLGKVIFIAPVFLFILYFVLFKYRGISSNTSIENIDRFIFWFQFMEYLEIASLKNLVIGNTPGFPIDVGTLVGGFDWFVENFKLINHIKGVHSFMFHSFWLRTCFTMGIPFTLFLIVVMIRRILTSKTGEALKCFYILLLLQGFSMSLFHITLLGIPLFLFYFNLRFDLDEN